MTKRKYNLNYIREKTLTNGLHSLRAFSSTSPSKQIHIQADGRFFLRLKLPMLSIIGLNFFWSRILKKMYKHSIIMDWNISFVKSSLDKIVCKLGWVSWNLSCFDDLPDFPHNIRIRLVQLKFLSVAFWCCLGSALLAVSVLKS